MNIRWHGQSAYTLTGESHTVAIDPFGDLGALMGGRRRFDYAPVPSHAADLLLVTHEHADHNAVEAITGSPQIVRSTAGRFETPLGEVVAINSEHDDAGGHRSAARTRSSCSRSTASACATSATSARLALRPGAAGGDRRRRPAVSARRRRPDDRRGRGRRDHGDARSTLGGADALPHRGDRLPRARRRLPGDVRAGHDHRIGARAERGRSRRPAHGGAACEAEARGGRSCPEP